MLCNWLLSILHLSWDASDHWPSNRNMTNRIQQLRRVAERLADKFSFEVPYAQQIRKRDGRKSDAKSGPKFPSGGVVGVPVGMITPGTTKSLHALVFLQLLITLQDVIGSWLWNVDLSLITLAPELTCFISCRIIYLHEVRGARPLPLPSSSSSSSARSQ